MWPLISERGRGVGRKVLVEGRPAGRVFDGAQARQGVVALDRELGDVLLDAHGGLQHLADHGHREPGELPGKLTNPLGGGDGEARGDPEGEREWLHASSLPYLRHPAQPNEWVRARCVTPSTAR
jgi:hypothetical protein